MTLVVRLTNAIYSGADKRPLPSNAPPIHSVAVEQARPDSLYNTEYQGVLDDDYHHHGDRWTHSARPRFLLFFIALLRENQVRYNNSKYIPI